MEVWKEFEHNEVTHSMAHYLMAIQDLLKGQGYARVTDVARELEITPGSASVSIKTLKSKGFVSEDKNRFLCLTESGEKLAHDIHVAKRGFVVFLKDVIGVDEEQADIDACKVEHLVSSQTREQLIKFLQFALSDNPAAKNFMKELHQHDFACPGVDKCSICEDHSCDIQ